MNQYFTFLNQFKQFCYKKKHSNYLVIPVTLGVEFLTSLYHDGKSFTTINSARSALSYYVQLIDEVHLDFGKHPLVVLFMRGIFKLRPALPRYKTTWDVKPVLDRLKDIDNKVSSLKDLSMKCATLIALTSGQRVQTLAAFTINNILSIEDKIILNIDKVLKTTRPGFHTTVELCSFPEDSRICPVQCLSTYIERTADIRNGNSLFVAVLKPHRAVCSQTISRWISTCLRISGIDISFCAHSTRSAAVSRAKHKAIDMTTILKTAGWANSKSFAKYYDKTISTGSSSPTKFVKAILS